MPKRDPVTGRSRLILEIDVLNKEARWLTTLYVLRYLPSDPSLGHPAWRLTKIDGSTSPDRYDVILTPHGPVCDCPDFIHCREHKDPRGCKHVLALRTQGVVE